MTAPTATGAWRKLSGLHDTRAAQAFPAPADGSVLSLDGCRFDHTRQRIDGEVLEALFALAREQDVEGWRARLYAGEAVNASEGRAALHMALRARPGDEWTTAGESATDMVLAERARCLAFADAVREGEHTGATGERFTDVVNIGIGGSHLGPALVADALAGRQSQVGSHVLRTHFVANVDRADLDRTLDRCRPASTLFIVASKTFTTQETLVNAIAARGWLTEALGADAVGAHFTAVTVHPDRAADFGISGRRVFSFWDWVGGRYSVWSAIGLGAMIALGRERFAAFLDGAREIDLHFRDAPLESNLPVRMALVAVWNRNFEGAASNAVLPYAEPLALLPAYLQQLEMESLGKRVDRDGSIVDYGTAPVVWGMPGTNGQHAFHQWLHQGTDPVAVDFIGFRDRGRAVNANLMAQARALAEGSDGGDALRDCPGARPSTVLSFDTLDARNLGRLLALYEHKVFVQSVVWNLNPFDQWGVELGKKLAKPLLESGADLF